MRAEAVRALSAAGGCQPGHRQAARSAGCRRARVRSRPRAAARPAPYCLTGASAAAVVRRPRAHPRAGGQPHARVVPEGHGARPAVQLHAGPRAPGLPARAHPEPARRRHRLHGGRAVRAPDARAARAGARASRLLPLSALAWVYPQTSDPVPCFPAACPGLAEFELVFRGRPSMEVVPCQCRAPGKREQARLHALAASL
jgi:hypothetical protein